ncbi:MAG: glycerate kinase [Firmicutes bacterium]|nr:glycerate kinase [Bacillota bacterium]
MKIICAPGAFKDVLTPFQAEEQISRAFRKVFPQAKLISMPLADGGEGTNEVLLGLRNGKRIQAVTTDAIGRDIIAEYISLDSHTAVIEAAQAIGFSQLPQAELNPYNTSSWGVGLLIRHAITQGYRRIYVALGDCIVNDGGIGAIAALGGRFLNAQGHTLAPTGRSLGQISSIDVQSIMDCSAVEIVALCDVKSPLLGIPEASLVHSSGKGASQRQKEFLEAGMENYCTKLELHCGRKISDLPWAGSCGGLAAALHIFLQAELRSGIETMLDLSAFSYAMDQADLLITAAEEVAGPYSPGRLLPGLYLCCKEKNIPIIMLVGSWNAEDSSYFQQDLAIPVPISRGYAVSKESFVQSPDLLYQAAERAARLLYLGMHL